MAKVTPVAATSPLPLGADAVSPAAAQWLLAGRIPSLDGMRAVAVLLVVLGHVYITNGFPKLHWRLRDMMGYTHIGVDIFFVISGLLITTLMLREIERAGRLHVGHFFLRRFLRIVPPYACLLLVVAGLQVFGLAHPSRGDWVAAVTYTVNFTSPERGWELGHAWSLSIEEHFYLVWPFVMVLSAGLGLRAALACMILCFGARWAVLLAFPEYTPMACVWTFTRIDSIVAGCLLAFLAWDPRWRVRLDRVCLPAWVAALAAAALYGSLAVGHDNLTFRVGIGYTLNAACIAVLLWYVVRRPHTWVGTLLNHWTMVSIGVASYSLYLWQQLFLNPKNDGFLCAFPLNLLLAFVAAYLSHYLIERPFLAMKPRAAPPAERHDAYAGSGRPVLAGAGPWGNVAGLRL